MGKTKDYTLDDVNSMRTRIYKMRIDELTEVYGSLRAVGKALDVDHAYLNRLRSGEKQNPSDKVLKKLGLT